MAKHTLYDYAGRPVDMGALKDEHAGPSVLGVRSILTTHPAGRLTPQRLANILRESEVPGDGSSEDYVELAEEMEERDLHYLGVLNTRKRQVARIGVVIEPASDSAEDLRDAELVQGFFEREAVTDELVDVLDAIGKGYSVAEIDWETSERDWMPKRLVHRLPQWFDFDRDAGEQLLLRKDDGWEPLQPYKFVTHVTKVKSGIAIRGGLARAAAWAWLFKTFTLKAWMRFVEAYGHPLRLGKYPPNADPDDKAVLYRAVRNVAADAAAIVPEGMNIEFVDDTTVRGRAEVFKEFVAYLDSRISIAVLGQTLTTEQGDRGSQSLGNVHQMVREDIEESDAQQLAGVLRRDFVIPVVALNHGTREAYPRVVIQRKKSADAKLLGDVLEKLVPMGLRVRADQVRSVLHLDDPADDDEVLEPPASTSPVVAAAMRRRDQLATAVARDRRPAIEQVVDAIEADEWQTLAAPIIEPILARAATNPEGLLRDLEAVYPDMKVDALTERLARVLFVADSWGRLTGERG